MATYIKYEITSRWEKRYQWDFHSCAVCCTSMVLDALLGEDVSIRDLKAELNTTTDGTSFSDVARVLREHGCRVVSRRSKPTKRDLKKSMNSCAIPIVSVTLDNGEEHAVLLEGIEDNGSLSIIDPSIKGYFRDVPPLSTGYIFAYPAWLSARVDCPWCRSRDIPVNEGPGDYDCSECGECFTVEP